MRVLFFSILLEIVWCYFLFQLYLIFADPVWIGEQRLDYVWYIIDAPLYRQIAETFAFIASPIAGIIWFYACTHDVRKEYFNGF